MRSQSALTGSRSTPVIQSKLVNVAPSHYWDMQLSGPYEKLQNAENQQTIQASDNISIRGGDCAAHSHPSLFFSVMLRRIKMCSIMWSDWRQSQHNEGVLPRITTIVSSLKSRWHVTLHSAINRVASVSVNLNRELLMAFWACPSQPGVEPGPLSSMTSYVSS